VNYAVTGLLIALGCYFAWLARNARVGRSPYLPSNVTMDRDLALDVNGGAAGLLFVCAILMLVDEVRALL
jgi:hypothetical protein